MPHILRILLVGVVVTLGTVTAGVGVARAQEPGEAVLGQLIERSGTERLPVAGATISVSDEGGAIVGSATTDDEGNWELELPGPGTYTAVLDQGSLPDGVALVDAEKGTNSFDVTPGERQRIVFPLGEGVTRDDSLVRRSSQLFVDGLQFGLIIAMAAVGLSLIYGTTGLVNFAHGEIVTWGALVAYWCNHYLFGGLSIAPATLVAIVFGGATGWALNALVFRQLRSRGISLIAQLVITIGLSFLFRNIFQYLFGGSTRPFRYAVEPGFDIGPVSITTRGLVTIGIALVVLGGVGLALQRSRIGKAIRAVADNRDLAESSGIDVERVISLVWIVGAMLATLGGILLGLDQQVSFQFGFQLLLLMFAGITLGGLGTAYGALVGSLIIGVFVQLSTLVVSTELKNVGALLILVLILLVRPQGLLGRRERVG